MNTPSRVLPSPAVAGDVGADLVALHEVSRRAVAGNAVDLDAIPPILAEMMLRAPGAVPPMVLLSAPAKRMATPSPPLPSARFSDTSVPMSLPCTRFRVALPPTMAIPVPLPREMRLPAPGAVPPMVLPDDSTGHALAVADRDRAAGVGADVVALHPVPRRAGECTFTEVNAAAVARDDVARRGSSFPRSGCGARERRLRPCRFPAGEATGDVDADVVALRTRFSVLAPLPTIMDAVGGARNDVAGSGGRAADQVVGASRRYTRHPKCRTSWPGRRCRKRPCRGSCPG